MSSCKYLLDLALILCATKFLGLVTRRVQLPQVVGALVAGLVLGPAALGWITDTDFISNIAEVGVIVLMFTAGMQTDISELKKSGLKAFVIAIIGVIVPLIGGYAIMAVYNPGADSQTVIKNIFIGVILTATSVSITVETLKELGKLTTRSGNAILGAALIDDVLGIIALTVITSFADSTVSIAISSLKILAFFAFCIVVAFLFVKFAIPWINSYKRDLRRFVILAFAFCLVMSYCAETFFGVSDITGAFVAGLILSDNKRTAFMLNRFDTVSYMLLSPVFFASVGLKVTLDSMGGSMIVFSVLLLIIAMLTKVLGCGLGAKMCRYTNLQSLKIGIGMISRGEVALIVATKGANLGLMDDKYFAPIIIVVVATTIITPILLKLVYKYQAKHPELVDVHRNTNLVDRYQSRYELEAYAQTASRMHSDISHKKPDESEE